MLICSEVYSIGSYLPTFGKLTRWQMSDNWRMRSGHKNDCERDWCGLD